MSQLVLDDDEIEVGRAWSLDLRRVGGVALVTAVLAASAAPFSFTSSTQPCISRGVARATGAMGLPRSGHTATLLRSGRVLVAGGWIESGYPNVTSSAELYDPSSGTWAATGSMNIARAFHSAVLLPSGKVLVMGGGAPNPINASFGAVASAELYDPDKGIWTETGSMLAGRDSFPAVVLRTGEVFVYGGGLSGARGAELYDPGSGTWSEAGGGVVGGLGTATLLTSGKVLVAGGGSYAAQLYEPATNAWRPAGVMTTGRSWHTATLLRSGEVLVAGGDDSGAPLERTSSAELYDPAKGTWTPARSMIKPHAGANAILLASGKVLIAGGGFAFERAGAVDSVDLYDPATASWTELEPMTALRAYFTATLLRSGALLFAGGENDRGFPSASAEIYALKCASD